MTLFLWVQDLGLFLLSSIYCKSQWLNISRENYLPFINVAESGPALINDYKNLGFIVVLLEED